MATRIITAFVALAVFFGVVFIKPIYFTAVVAAVILIMLYECFGAQKTSKSVKIIGYISGILLMAGFYTGFVVEAVAAVIAMFMITVIALHGKTEHKEIFSVAFLTMYIVTFMYFIVKVRSEYSIFAMLLIFLCAWMTDTGAYFAGVFLGKHKLIPHVSPKKTVEGSIGGIIVCMLSCMLYLFIVNKFWHGMEDMSYLRVALIGAVASVISQLGDLVASAIKRDCDIKDYGNIFPGHGGFMDRFDSVIFIAPFIYYAMTLVK